LALSLGELLGVDMINLQSSDGDSD
jgi:hypothetical protein